MIGVNVWLVYLAPQNISRAIVLTFGNKVILYCIVLFYRHALTQGFLKTLLPLTFWQQFAIFPSEMSVYVCVTIIIVSIGNTQNLRKNAYCFCVSCTYLLSLWLRWINTFGLNQSVRYCKRGCHPTVGDTAWSECFKRKHISLLLSFCSFFVIHAFLFKIVRIIVHDFFQGHFKTLCKATSKHLASKQTVKLKKQ